MNRFSYFSDPSFTSGTFPHDHIPLSGEKHLKAVVSHKLQRGEVQASLFSDRLRYLRRPIKAQTNRQNVWVKEADMCDILQKPEAQEVLINY